MKKTIVSLIKAIVLLVVINVIATFVYTRFDITEDRRFTLTKPAVATVEKFKSPGIIEIQFC